MTRVILDGVMMQDSQYKAFLKNNSFLSMMMLYIEKSLEDIKVSAAESTAKLMESSLEMGQLSSQRKAEAEKMMSQAHFSPDTDLEKEIEANQQDVDSILEEAKSTSQEDGEVDSKEVARAQARRAGGKFSKNIEAISMYEEKLTEILVKMAGSLSNEDVMKQLLENVILGQEALIKFFSSMPTDLSDPMLGKDIEDMIKDIVEESQKRCRSTQERRALEASLKRYNGSIDTFDRINNLSQVAGVLNFVFSYSHFLKTLIGMLKSGYSDIIETATDSIYAINDSASAMKFHADSLMRQSEEGDFKNVSMSQVEQEEDSIFGDSVDTKSHNPDILVIPKGILENMDVDVGNQLMTMMGCLSIGDVIGQRIGNINKAFDALHRILNFFQTDLDRKLNPATTDKIHKDCIAFIKKTFVTEEERILFEDLLLKSK